MDESEKPFTHDNSIVFLKHEIFFLSLLDLLDVDRDSFLGAVGKSPQHMRVF